MGRMDDWAADVRKRRAARQAFLALSPEQRQAELLKALGQRDDLPVQALDHVAYLAESFNADGVPDLDKVPESSREPLEAALKSRGLLYVGGRTDEDPRSAG